MDIKQELNKLKSDLLKGCRLTQEAISKVSGILMSSDDKKIEEIIECDKQIGIFCNSFQEYFSGIIRQRQLKGEHAEFISSGMRVYFELKQTAVLTAAIAMSSRDLGAEIPIDHRINISQFVKIYQNIVWDAVMAFLKEDQILARKILASSTELNKICGRMQDRLLEDHGSAEPMAKSRSALLFIVWRVMDIATHAVNIVQTIPFESDKMISLC
ncbi:MAG: PhoU domain-containing protein [Candidatus Omnitrophica bacterium]|nr:PhoU domain-containing protein [Candidatus Omnitrophota bacterium]